MDWGIFVGIALVALVLGGLIGWLFATRDGAAAKQTVGTLRLQLDEVVKERDQVRAFHEAASKELAALQADARNFEQRIKDLAESKDALIAQFREIGDQLLEKAHKDFLEKAGERFTAADKASETKLKELLAPVEVTLKRYEEGLQRVEKERIDHYAGLKSVVEQVRDGQGKVRDETRNLVNALRSSPKARGRWGEQSLRNVLEQAGLSPYADFQTEVSVDGEDGKLRPDVIVKLPGGRTLVIDAKCSLNAYLDACDEVDDDKRQACLQAHLASIRTHAQQLGSKAYWAQFGDSADYVVMYIPGEHFLTAALELDHGLWDWANERKVLLATPTNLVAIARTVASIWNQEKLAAEAGKIAELGRELHSRLATMAEHVSSVGTNLSRANNAYNKMVGSLESQVFTQARRFEDLGAGSAKEIPPPPMVEASPRPLTKLATKDDPVVVSLDGPLSMRLEPAEEEDDTA
ncbi:DNA recombination protein RmuC [Sphingomonas sp. RG327]|uniref:DNA recombination protein RmuC homolog n=1 Tax=Sphingomonas anseongensis TaxID=2908207 RepID=A0ABT0RE69_9SPHN|nr:DNA recombination protein RmuC [Sphingomonas anseongensis]MCL6678557.1 DNA recombination protein RmuC [Sphingomonas anseongensis]